MSGQTRHLTPEIAERYEWQGRVQGQVRELLHSLFGPVREATYAEDHKLATDYVAERTGARVAVRVRKPRIWRRELTIRGGYNARFGVASSELDKVRAEQVDYMLVCWTEPPAIIREYIVADVHALVRSGLLDRARRCEDSERDAWYLTIPCEQLYRAACVWSGGEWRGAAVLATPGGQRGSC